MDRARATDAISVLNDDRYQCAGRNKQSAAKRIALSLIAPYWLKSRLANRVQLTSDGHRAYLEAVEGGFGGDVDYARLVKMYGATRKA
jgi:hypothetical protein